MCLRSSNKLTDHLLISTGADDDGRLIVWDFVDRVMLSEAPNIYRDYRGTIYNLNIVRFEDPRNQSQSPFFGPEEEGFSKSNISSHSDDSVAGGNGLC
jgi:hypothetical protein